jgi:hypothetical protein
MDTQKLKILLQEINEIGISYRGIRTICTEGIETIREEADNVYRLSLEALDIIREDEIDNLLKERNYGNVSDKG